jgi:hypothetical protein
VNLSETIGVGSSLDRRMRELVASVAAQEAAAQERDPADADPDLEHLAILVRWQGSTWRDGEWIGFDSFEKPPYRKLVNAMGRVAASARPPAGTQAGT